MLDEDSLYRIVIASDKNGQPSGWALDAQRLVRKDKRTKICVDNPGSTYAMIVKGDGGAWRISPATAVPDVSEYRPRLPTVSVGVCAILFSVVSRSQYHHARARHKIRIDLSNLHLWPLASERVTA